MKCCNNPIHTTYNLEHDGDTVYAYSTCENCETTVRDVFTYSTTERVD